MFGVTAPHTPKYGNLIKEENYMPLPPAPRHLKYRDFQVRAIQLARERKRLLISLPMGTGKTVVAAGVINDQEAIRKTLIVCPANLRLNWRRELLRWLTRKGMTIGFASTRHGFPLTDIVVINYDILKKFTRIIHATHWDLLIADEAHYLRSLKAGRTIVIFGRKNKDPLKQRPKLDVDRCLLLTGTPIINRPLELWPLLHYLDSEEWDSKKHFINRYCGGKAKGQNKNDIGETALKELNQRLTSTIMIRRTKEELLPELPPKTRQVIVLPNDKARGAVTKERKEYEKIQQNLSRARMRAELAKTTDNDELYKTVVQELRQIEFLSIQQISRLRMETAIAKIPIVVEHIYELFEHVQKLVVFAHHTAVIENIAMEFGNGVAKAHGKISPADRQKAIDRFTEDSQCRLFLGSIRATGEGIDLTAASVMCFAELDWTPKTLEQCEDRCWRMGQQQNVLVQHLVLDGTLDARLAHRIVEKQETISTILDNDTETQASLYSLSRATPFTDTGREKILEMGQNLSTPDIAKIHSSINSFINRGKPRSFSSLDFGLLQILNNQDALEPAQAALALLLLNKAL